MDNQCNNCGEEICKYCGECHDTQCYEYEKECITYVLIETDIRETEVKQLADKDARLKEAIELLKMWKELSWPSTSMVNSYHTAKKRMLDERTARFLEKEGKNE